MDITASIAAQAYARARPATTPAQGSGAPDGQVAAGFARLTDSFAQTVQRGEETAKAAMTGRADAHALVEALAATELAVETAVTVRDRVVEAYQEILRMPV
jgi:flagellar hook-basal body complex protein FliE